MKSFLVLWTQYHKIAMWSQFCDFTNTKIATALLSDTSLSRCENRYKIQNELIAKLNLLGVAVESQNYLLEYWSKTGEM